MRKGILGTALVLLGLGFVTTSYGPSFRSESRLSRQIQSATAFNDLAPRDLGASPAPFAVIGDTQRTLLVERLIGRENNDHERPILIQGLLDDHPGVVVHLGDMVDDGASRTAWNYFDELTAGIRGAGIPLLPCLGNHDYWHFLSSKSDLTASMDERFPFLKGVSWYSRTYGPIGMVFLNSNPGQLTAEEWANQKAWLQSALSAFDGNPRIRGVLVFEHHPPYTNSKTTGDEAFVQSDFLPLLDKSAKFVAMITGHAHAYEHFVMAGKDFIVSGGGGGPRVKLRQGSSARHTDLFQGPSPRPLHYLLLTPTAEAIHVAARGFEKGPDERVQTFDEFDLRYPK